MTSSRTGLGPPRGVPPRTTGSGSSGKHPVAPSPQDGTINDGPRIGHGPRTSPTLGRADKGVNSGKR